MVIFCLLTAVLPTILIIIPLYLRHNVFSDVVYEVTESDVLEIGDEISTIFCQVGDTELKHHSAVQQWPSFESGGSISCLPLSSE